MFYPDILEEHGEAMRRYQRYLSDWVAEARRLSKIDVAYVVARSFLPLGAGISLFSRKETRHGTKKVKWCVFGIPVMKRKSMQPDCNKYLFMGFIPLPSVIAESFERLCAFCKRFVYMKRFRKKWR